MAIHVLDMWSLSQVSDTQTTSTELTFTTVLNSSNLLFMDCGFVLIKDGMVHLGVPMTLRFVEFWPGWGWWILFLFCGMTVGIFLCFLIPALQPRLYTSIELYFMYIQWHGNTVLIQFWCRILTHFPSNAVLVMAAGNETENCDLLLDCSKYLKNLS